MSQETKPLRLVVLVSISMFGLAVILQASPKKATSGPTIQWTPSAVNTTVLAGESKVIKVSFVSAETLQDVSIRIVPEVKPYVHVLPAQFDKINDGVPTTLDVSLTVPAETLPQMLSGAVQLRSTKYNNGLLARPLPLNLSIEWPRLTNTDLGISLQYPPGYVPNENVGPNSKELGFSENQAAYDAGLAPAFVVTVNPPQFRQSVRDWIHSFGVADENIVETVVAAHSFLKWSEGQGEGSGEGVSYSTSTPGGNILTVTVYSSSLASTTALEGIISSLTFTKP